MDRPFKASALGPRGLQSLREFGTIAAVGERRRSVAVVPDTSGGASFAGQAATRRAVATRSNAGCLQRRFLYSGMKTFISPGGDWSL
jgi:hypothetical protein